MNMDLFTGLWHILKDIVGWFQVCTFIDPWEEGILVRRGKFKRVVKGGVAWHLPFGQDHLHTVNVRPTAMELDEQTVETGDGVTIVCSGVLMWSIFDVKKSMIDVEDAAETLSDIAVGVIQEMVEGQDWEYIKSDAFRKDVRRAIQKQARKWGIKVPSFKFHDLARVYAFRVF